MTAEGSLEWSLCECTVTEDGVIKQRRLPAQMQNLAERIALNSRLVELHACISTLLDFRVIFQVLPKEQQPLGTSCS